ncbi:MAG TPA: hypothetical protein DIS53_03510 [Candidatus Wildermuthbacteria bacterium]|uniref:DUF5667 domain-containing protein n=1 Tax=Candidatus Yanofskybacteria bacterium GW2011_GWC1_48_11 TaxID=1619027 RepID=A0A837IQU6_9BACT|nr:MAG: hypothetical protein UY25_C0002G0057 [Candidatus Yanofskybacteria bacterium GW2011_GWC1_48_11]KKW04695.1 MAG: hypothetical protein UY38_C0001G0262 [Parcubacteria group bacterium GW2011_GWB1_49_12]KKW09005.1 MAG: hypothetical protein UY45_C0002G0057 [Parcubacteria group bacterium GW2011_GWA1_49_26]KKW14225.1 MAG: hypothetical protein UY53_C0002G0014 [Parcubacteria group bacterium GW2011_GWA2_50_10]OHA61058.1 MAG: hypothetical protein A2109_02285 [Candidatus Wildermuthbacteria bacterium G
MHKIGSKHCATFRKTMLHNVFVRRFVFLALLASFALPTSIFAQGDPIFRAPDTLEGVKEDVLNIGDKVLQAIPRIIGRIWSEQVLPAWRKMGNWAKEEIWEKRVSPALQTIGDRIKELLGREVEKRTESAQESLEEQGEELTGELREQTERAKQSIWERFKALFQMD